VFTYLALLNYFVVAISAIVLDLMIGGIVGGVASAKAATNIPIG
jgi:hypothetical protein